MKVKIFNLPVSDLPDPGLTIPELVQTRTVSVLPAYAIDHAFFIINGILYPIDGRNIEINGKDIIRRIGENDFFLDNQDTLQIQIYYHGIRDYRLIFPSIQAVDPSRAERLASIYEEAEACFNAGAWLAFALMSGGIFDNVLYHKLGSPSDSRLVSMVNEAMTRGLISNNEGKIINSIRQFRNAIHGNNLASPYISRANAMDIYSVSEKLILSL